MDLSHQAATGSLFDCYVISGTIWQLFRQMCQAVHHMTNSDAIWCEFWRTTPYLTRYGIFGRHIVLHTATISYFSLYRGSFDTKRIDSRHIVHTA